MTIYKTIDDLPAASSTSVSDQLEVSQGGVSRRITAGQIGALVSAVQRTTTVTFYVATTGNDGNDGGSAASPVLTLQKALDLCAATAAFSSGPFTINIAAGTYTTATPLSFSSWVFNSSSPVTFAGVNTGSTPSVIIQGSSDGTRTHDFINVAGYGMLFVFQDIFFRSFSTAVSATQFGRISLVRCWIKNCLFGASCANGGFCFASGGDWDGRDLSDTMVPSGSGLIAAIVSPFNLTQAGYTGLLIHHWQTGATLSESCSGHMDFLRYEDCTTGVLLMRGAGAANMTNTRFWRCTTGILSRSVNDILINASQDFGQGTANACGTNLVCTAAPVLEQETESVFKSRQEFKALSQSVASGTLTGSVAERDWMNPVCKIMLGRTRLNDTLDLRIHANGNLTTVGTARLYFGATLITTWTMPIGTTDARVEVMLESLNGTDWRGQIYQLAGPSATSVASVINIPDALGVSSLTAETLVKLTWQAGAAADSIRMRVFRLYSSIAGLAF